MIKSVAEVALPMVELVSQVEAVSVVAIGGVDSMLEDAAAGQLLVSLIKLVLVPEVAFPMVDLVS